MGQSPEPDHIRVSCAALSRIEIDGKFLLEVNKNRGNVLTPIGGALEFHEAARPFLNSLGAEFEKQSDLRLMLPPSRLPKFRDWFLARRDLECDPVRELREQLIDGHGGLPQWPGCDLPQRFLRLFEHEERTTRKESAGTLTRYYYEVFAVTLPEKLSRACVEAANSPGSGLRILAPAEIVRLSEPDCSPEDGMKAAITCRFVAES